jgi:hypothetical protein
LRCLCLSALTSCRGRILCYLCCAPKPKRFCCPLPIPIPPC